MRNSDTKKTTLYVERGFTLIELLIVIALIAGVYAIAMPNLMTRSSSEIANSVNRIASDVRAAYDMSVLTQRYHRLVFDLKAGTYWLEETEADDIIIGEENSPVDPSSDEEKELEEKFTTEFQRYKELIGEEISDPNSDTKIPRSSPVIQAEKILKRPKWSPVETLEWSKRQLVSALAFKDFQAEHHSQKIVIENENDHPRAFLYFYPQGYVERAVMHIYFVKSDGSFDEAQKPFTIYTWPYRGEAEIQNGIIEVDVREAKESEEEDT